MNILGDMDKFLEKLKTIRYLNHYLKSTGETLVVKMAGVPFLPS